jgi:hypothetical protein
MSYPSTAILARMKAVTERYMQDTGTIRRTNRTTNLLADVATGVRCWIYRQTMPSAPQDRELNQNASIYRLVVPVGTDLRQGDQFDTGSNSYTVWEVYDDQTPLVFLEAVVHKVTP